MAKRPGNDDEMPSPTVIRNFSAELNTRDVNVDGGDEAEDVCLDEILTLYSQPINEEQAWAVCYQCCRTLAQKHRRKGSAKSTGASALDCPRRIEGPGNVRISRDGTVTLHFEDSTGESTNPDQTSIVVWIHEAAKLNEYLLDVYSFPLRPNGWSISSRRGHVVAADF